MNLRKALAVSTIAVLLGSGAAIAQDHHDDDQAQHSQYVHHSEWKKGYHMKHEDWDRGQPVDWRTHHLRTPPAGYNWRLIDGNYVCANSRGVVFSVVIAR